MSKAKFDQDTRDFIEQVFTDNNYSLDDQIRFLENRERRIYNYYTAKTNGNWGWTKEEDRQYNSEWNEVLEMLKERKGN